MLEAEELPSVLVPLLVHGDPAMLVVVSPAVAITTASPKGRSNNPTENKSLKHVLIYSTLSVPHCRERIIRHPLAIHCIVEMERDSTQSEVWSYFPPYLFPLTSLCIFDLLKKSCASVARSCKFGWSWKFTQSTHVSRVRHLLLKGA